MKKVLFICSHNRLRSPTAEQIFSNYPGIKTASAGVRLDAVQTVTKELLDWADLIFVMEPMHLEELSQRFETNIKNKTIICLDIPDRFDFMSPQLILQLENKVLPYLE